MDFIDSFFDFEGIRKNKLGVGKYISPLKNTIMSYRFYPNIIAILGNFFILTLGVWYTWTMIQHQNFTWRSIGISVFLLLLSSIVVFFLRFFRIQDNILSIYYPFRFKTVRFSLTEIDHFTLKETIDESIFPLVHLHFFLKNGEEYSISNHDIFGFKKFHDFLKHNVPNNTNKDEEMNPLPYATHSPNKTFQLHIQSSEMRMSHWINTIKITHRSGRVLLDLHDSVFHVGDVKWLENNHLEVSFCKYPNREKVVQLLLDLDNEKVLLPSVMNLNDLMEWLELNLK